MAKLKEFCQQSWTDKNGVNRECGMQLIVIETLKLSDTEELITYQCGHAAIKPIGVALASKKNFRTESIDKTKSLWDYQIEGVNFGIETNYNCLIADQMALGKTPQALMLLASDYANLSPCLIIVKSATIWQWLAQYKTWCDSLPLGVFMITGTKGIIPPAFNAYLISMDSLGRNGMVERLKAFGFKMVIVDECHSFKDSSSKRTQALVDLIQSGGIKHKIFLSGTPIKNRADEYFVPLNLLAPDRFPSLANFRHKWLEQDDKDKWGKIKEWKQQEFRDLISQWVIRRERNQVLTNLPPFRRTYTEITIENQALKDLYNKELIKLEEKLGHKVTFWDIQENLMTLRRITGMAKVEWAYDYVKEFLEETEHEKIAIGIHHHGVRDLLKYKFQGFEQPVLFLGGEDSAENKNKIVERFKRPENRILVIGMLAGGVGLDGLQCCNNVITLERQWSAADEEQFEDRFNRPGQLLPVTAEYPLARGTVDTYFNELVEIKRQIFGSAVGNNWNLMQDEGSVREMVEWTVSHRL